MPPKRKAAASRKAATPAARRQKTAEAAAAAEETTAVEVPGSRKDWLAPFHEMYVSRELTDVVLGNTYGKQYEKKWPKLEQVLVYHKSTSPSDVPKELLDFHGNMYHITYTISLNKTSTNIVRGTKFPKDSTRPVNCLCAHLCFESSSPKAVRIGKVSCSVSVLVLLLSTYVSLAKDNSVDGIKCVQRGIYVGEHRRMVC